MGIVCLIFPVKSATITVFKAASAIHNWPEAKTKATGAAKPFSSTGLLLTEYLVTLP